jgi:isopenicillin N synthase-like dioxygenase
MAPADRSRSPHGRGSQETLVPIIDISALSPGRDASARREVAKKIGKACEEIGFFIVVNHGIPKDVIDTAWNKTLDFFDLPMEAKSKFTSDDDSKYPYGYSALGGENLARGKRVDGKAEDKGAGDMKEMMQMGPKDPLGGMPERRMPTNEVLEGFSDAWDAYYEQANSLANRLLGAFALALELPEDFFVSMVDKHISALRANNYPSQKGMVVPAGSIRASAHTDYGTVTILRSGGPGLQVSKDKENPVWHDVPYVEDGFVINLGDLMRRWTNDKWSSTLHRVINPPADQVAAWGRRLGVAFFHNLNKDAQVEVIPSCVAKGESALYDPIVAGEFLMLKHLASIGKADPDAHLKRRSSDSHPAAAANA